jgi:hypothetical protein
MKMCIRLFAWISPILLFSACAVPPATLAPTDTQIPPAEANTQTPVPPTKTRPRVLTNTRIVTPYKSKTPTSESALPATTTTTATTESEEDIQLALGVVRFTLPAGLAKSATLVTTTREEWPAVNPSLGLFPEHWVITLEEYSVKNTGITPEIIIFHADEFAEFYPDINEALRQLKNNPDGPVPAGALMPRFNAHIYVLPSSNGVGVRYLTQFFMDYFPVNNRDIFYYYAGLSSDGGYYISMRMPVNASFLPADSGESSKLPSDGIPFPKNVDNSSFAEYVAKVSEKINTTKAEDFKPSLLLMDGLARSIRIQ